MEFRVLGPLEVREGDRVLPVGRGKQSALPALLLLHPDHALSTDRLIDELWGERPPPTARKALQVNVAELRKALGAGAIVTRVPTYALAVEGHEVDLHRFERLVEDARAADAGSDDGACNGDCSLREAVTAADDASGPDTITLHAETYGLALGELDVTGVVTIAGAGADRSILDAGGASRAFHVEEGADARIAGVTIRHGRTSGAGAGILNQGTLSRSDAVVADNSAVGGGGVHNLGTATLSDVTLSGNGSAESAAALSNYGTMTVTNSTVTGSVIRPEGVSVAGNQGALALRNVTLAPTTGFVLGEYFASEVTLVNTIVDGACEGTPESLGHNLESGHTCGLELTDSDPLLEPLAGAPLPTHGLAADSPAIDAGDDGACPAADERGVASPQGAHCDIGAVEAATVVVPRPAPRPRRGTVSSPSARPAPRARSRPPPAMSCGRARRAPHRSGSCGPAAWTRSTPPTRARTRYRCSTASRAPGWGRSRWDRRRTT